MNQPRQPKGTPTGGQFAPGARSEAAGTLTRNPWDKSVSDAISEQGESSVQFFGTDVETHMPPLDRSIVDEAGVVRGDDDGSFQAYGATLVDMCEVYDDKTPEEAERLLDAHAPAIEKWVAETYDADIDGETWESTSIEFTTDIPGEASLADAGDAVYENTEVVTLHNALNGGFQTPQFYSSLRVHLDALDGS